MITSTAATAVAGSAAAAAPVARPMTPVTVQTLVAMIAMYARCGGIHTLSRRAANAALTRMKRPEASAIGVPTANAIQSVASVTSWRATSHCSGRARETAAA